MMTIIIQNLSNYRMIIIIQFDVDTCYTAYQQYAK
jgi:hypothetical protein